jgi:hypothetical protein
MRAGRLNAGDLDTRGKRASRRYTMGPDLSVMVLTCEWPRTGAPRACKRSNPRRSRDTVALVRTTPPASLPLSHTVVRRSAGTGRESAVGAYGLVLGTYNVWHSARQVTGWRRGRWCATETVDEVGEGLA